MNWVLISGVGITFGLSVFIFAIFFSKIILYFYAILEKLKTKTRSSVTSKYFIETLDLDLTVDFFFGRKTMRNSVAMYL